MVNFQVYHISNSSQWMSHLLFNIMAPKNAVGFDSCLVNVWKLSGSGTVLLTNFT
jgi:hypothetical protein